MTRDFVRAKAVICEIIRLAGGRLQSKARLYKAFWYAHVAYHKLGHVAPLTRWPIARMPEGPGIDDFDTLLANLLEENLLTVEDVVFDDGRSAFQFALGKSDQRFSLTPDEAVAIRHGFEYIKGKTAAQASDASHADSRSWRDSTNGSTLDPFADAMSDEHWSAAETRLNAARKHMRAILAAG